MSKERKIEIHAVRGRRGQADIPIDFEEAIDAAENGETTALLGKGKPIALLVPAAPLRSELAQSGNYTYVITVYTSADNQELAREQLKRCVTLPHHMLAELAPASSAPAPKDKDPDLDLADRLEQASKDMRKAAHPSRMGVVPSGALAAQLYAAESMLRVLATRLRERTEAREAEEAARAAAYLAFPRSPQT